MMAPTLGLIEEKDVSAGVATAESSQVLQMNSANRGNRVHDGTTLPREKQTENDSISPSQELQAGAEEQRFVGSTSRNTVSAQARQAAAAPECTQRLQSVVNNSSHPSILDQLIHEQEEQAAEQAKFHDQIQRTLMAQVQMSQEHQAAREKSRSEMKKVFEQLRKSDERAQESNAKAQKTLSEVEKMREELKKREEDLEELTRKRDEDLKELSTRRDEEMKELSRKVDESVRVGIQAAVDEERKITLKAIKKETKKEARREKVKEEKKAGKPRKNWSYYNIHVREERLRLKASGSKEDLFLVASLTWKEMDEEEKEERYGGVFKVDKERYEREMEEWWEKAKVPLDQRKPAAKPTSVDNAATADPRESVAHSPPEESAPTAADPVASDAVSLSSYEQQRLARIARNNERLRSLGLLSPTGIEAQSNGGILSRAAVEGSNKAGIGRSEEPSQPPHEESVAVAVAENCPRVADTPPVTTVVIHRRQDQEAYGASVNSSIATAHPEAAPLLGVLRNSVEEPAHGKEAEFASPSDVNVNYHRDSAEDLIGAPPRLHLQESTASLPVNVQELPSATPRRRRGKKRKNHSPYWYGNAPVYELEGYTDGTPLPAGYVWVEYESGVAVKVQEIALTKKLPPRNSSRKLKHNLFTASSTSRQAEGAETSHVNCSRGSNDVSEVPFPVGYKFYHNVLGGIYHRGYRCVAEVKEVIGDNDGNFASPGSARRCCYYDLDDGSLRGEGNPLVKTIEKKKVYKN